MIEDTQKLKDKFLDSASNGDIATVKGMIYDGVVNILCTNDFDSPYRDGSRGKNASYFALLNGHIDIVEYLIKITSGVIINNSIDDDLIYKIALKGDLETLSWMQENLFYGRHEKMVGFTAIIKLFRDNEHELVEKIGLHFKLNTNVITDNLIEERKRMNTHLKGESLVRSNRDIEIDKLTKPVYKVNV